MSQPHVSLDPRDADPLHVAEREAEAWEAGYAAAIDERRWRVAGLLLAALSGALVGLLLGIGIANAAPRSGSLPSIPVADAGQTGEPSLPAAVEAAPSRSSGELPLGAPPTPPMPDGSSISGIASWYDTPGPGLYAAVPSWRWGDTPYRVRVTAGSRSVVVVVGDFCRCPGGRVIDLSADAFARLAPLSAGLVRVTVERLGAGVTPPPTSAEGEP